MKTIHWLRIFTPYELCIILLSQGATFNFINVKITRFCVVFIVFSGSLWSVLSGNSTSAVSLFVTINSNSRIPFNDEGLHTDPRNVFSIHIFRLWMHFGRLQYCCIFLMWKWKPLLAPFSKLGNFSNSTPWSFGNLA